MARLHIKLVLTTSLRQHLCGFCSCDPAFLRCAVHTQPLHCRCHVPHSDPAPRREVGSKYGTRVGTWIAVKLSSHGGVRLSLTVTNRSCSEPMDEADMDALEVLVGDLPTHVGSELFHVMDPPLLHIAQRAWVQLPSRKQILLWSIPGSFHGFEFSVEAWCWACALRLTVAAA